MEYPRYSLRLPSEILHDSDTESDEEKEIEIEREKEKVNSPSQRYYHNDYYISPCSPLVITYVEGKEEKERKQTPFQKRIQKHYKRVFFFLNHLRRADHIGKAFFAIQLYTYLMSQGYHDFKKTKNGHLLCTTIVSKAIELLQQCEKEITYEISHNDDIKTFVQLKNVLQLFLCQIVNESETNVK